MRVSGWRGPFFESLVLHSFTLWGVQRGLPLCFDFFAFRDSIPARLIVLAALSGSTPVPRSLAGP